MSTVAGDVVAFIHELRFEDLLPPDVRERTAMLLLDLAGVAAAGSTTRLSAIIRGFAARHMAAGEGHGARMLLDGRRVSPIGAAFAGAAIIDSFDAHDGHALTKGHVGVAILPALLAYVDRGFKIDGREVLVSLVLGYELGTRAGIALHASAADYHSSGAWNALACAALGARLLRLDREATRHALGIAEYGGPRSPMMRCIDHPTMVKDGSGLGALAGVSAAYLAAEGFTGAPAELVERPEHQEHWADLGARWRTLEQYVKPHPICRWAQPAVEAALALKRHLGIEAEEIETVEVASFHQAVRLALRAPGTTEQAQYSLPFPVAAALVHDRLGLSEIGDEGLLEPAILRLSRSMVLTEQAAYSGRFPAERWAHVAFTLNDGRRLESQPTIARGGPENFLDGHELRAKYRVLAEPVLGPERTARIEQAVLRLAESEDIDTLLEDLLEPV